MDVSALHTNTRDISLEVLDENGRLRILPAAYWATTTAQERAKLGMRHGIYAFPTVELVERLREIIGDRSAIEIGAGTGVLAEALDIPATDSRQQDRPEIQLLYKALRQSTVPYGPNVLTMDGNQAVRRLKPQVVVAAWVTHKWDDKRPQAEGNAFGVDELAILYRAELYVFVGNEKVHEGKAIWDQPHTIEYPPYLYSRAVNGSRDFLAIWEGHRKA